MERSEVAAGPEQQSELFITRVFALRESSAETATRFPEGSTVPSQRKQKYIGHSKASVLPFGKHS